MPQKVELVDQEIKIIEKAKFEASIYLEIYLGNMLYPANPLKVVVDGKEMYKIPIKSASDDSGSHIFGYLYMDPQTMEVNKNLSSSRDDIDKVAEEIIK